MAERRRAAATPPRAGPSRDELVRLMGEATPA